MGFLNALEIAPQADLWYNKALKTCVTAMLETSRDWPHLLRRCDVNTLPPHAQNDNSPFPIASGIYRITCVPTGKIYIGGTVDLRRRQYTHLYLLRRNKHHSPTLQRAWNKYGEGAFIFEILELVLVPEMLTAREQHYLDALKPFGKRGFNIAQFAGSTQGRKHTEETKEKIRQVNLGRKQSLETREKRKQTQLGKNSFLGKKHTAESIEKNRQAHLGKSTWLGREHSAETREKLRQINLGRKHTPESIEKNRQSSTGRKHTPEAIEKIRQSKLGKKRSPEAVENMRQARWGKKEGDSLL